jgi:hypothetical protein
MYPGIWEANPPNIATYGQIPGIIRRGSLAMRQGALATHITGYLADTGQLPRHPGKTTEAFCA